MTLLPRPRGRALCARLVGKIENEVFGFASTRGDIIADARERIAASEPEWHECVRNAARSRIIHERRSVIRRAKQILHTLMLTRLRGSNRLEPGDNLPDVPVAARLELERLQRIDRKHRRLERAAQERRRQLDEIDRLDAMVEFEQDAMVAMASGDAAPDRADYGLGEDAK